MNIRKCRVATGAGLLLSSVVLVSPGDILGGDLVVEKSNSLTMTMDGSTAQSDNIVMYDAAVVHDNILVERLNQGSNKLGIKTLALSLGPDAGDNPKVTLHNESWNDERCLLAASNTIEVGKSGGWGSFDVDGGSLQSKSLSVCADAAVPEDAVLLTLSKNYNVPGKLYFNKLFNNAASGVAIRFNGGVIRPNYGSDTRLFRPVAGDIVLSSFNANAIKIVNENPYAGYYLMEPYWLATYAGKLRTEGDGDFVVEGSLLSGGKVYYADELVLMLDKNVKSSVVWGHKGDFVLKNHSVSLSADNVVPANANTGIIRLSCADPEHPAVFKMGSHNQTVNGIAVADGEYGKVVAEAGTVLTVGLYKDGELTNVDLGDEVKIVQENKTVKFACESVSDYQVKAGTLKIMRSTKIGTLELASGVTVDIADGAVLQVGTLKDEGSVFTGKGILDIAEGGAYLDKTYDVKTVKSGPGTFVYNQKAPMGDVDVLGGTLKLAGTGSTNEWWRVTVKTSGWNLNIAAIGLFAGSTFDSVLDGYEYSQATDAASIGRGQIYYDTTKYEYVITTGNAISGNPVVSFANDASVLLDSDWATAMTFRSSNGSSQNPTDIAFTFRRAEEDTVPVTSFSIRYPVNAYSSSHNYAARSANEYFIETSVDGDKWMEVGRVYGRGKGEYGSWTDDSSFPMTFAPGVPVSGGLGLAEGAAVRVAFGATLDLTDSAGNNFVSKLVVDANGDNGTILGAALPEEGVVIVKNFTTKEALRNAKLLSFPGMTARLSGWQVQDESGNPIHIEFTVRDGEMVALDGGLVITVR